MIPERSAAVKIERKLPKNTFKAGPIPRGGGGGGNSHILAYRMCQFFRVLICLENKFLGLFYSL